MVRFQTLFPDVAPRVITALCLGALLFASYTYAPALLSLLLAGALMIILVHEWPRLDCWWLAPLFPVAPMLILIFLNQSPERRLLLFIILFSTLFDCAGYFAGTLWGRHQLAPRLSPRKTWEGLAAGYIILFALYPWLATAFSLKDIGWWAIPFIFTYGTLAISGDLVVSCLKRKVGLKDSSNLLPGHGGLLDRFASYLLTSVFVYACKSYLA